MEPEHIFFPWKFTTAPMGTWKERSNHILFFQYVQSKIGIEREQDWYSHLSRSLILGLGGGGLLSNHYNGSPFHFLSSMIPHHRWDVWKFKWTPMNFWRSMSRRIDYFEWLCQELKFLIPHEFYSLSLDLIEENGGKGLVSSYFSNSPESFVCCLNPEIKWIQWLFKSNHKWGDTENHRRYFEWIGEEMGCTDVSHWKRLTRLNIEALNGGTLIREYYNNSVDEFIHAHLKEFTINYELWWKKKCRLFRSGSLFSHMLDISFFDWICGKMKFETPECARRNLSSQNVVDWRKIVKYCGDSIEEFVVRMHPEIKWVERDLNTIPSSHQYSHDERKQRIVQKWMEDALYQLFPKQFMPP